MEEKEKIINDKVDELLVKMEGYFKEAVENHRPLQDGLNDKVKELMAEFDAKEETKRYEMVKSFADYIALTVGMPLPEEIKEAIIEALVKECEKDGDEEKV